MKIHVSHLGSQVTTQSLECIFGTYGWVEQSSIFTKTAGNGLDSCRCAEVVMPDAHAALHAVKSLNGSFVNGLRMEVSLS